jgi:hypothetical protein
MKQVKLFEILPMGNEYSLIFFLFVVNIVDEYIKYFGT